MAIGCFKVHPDDNVATMLLSAKAGPVHMNGVAGDAVIDLCEAIELGHKVALCDIDKGDAIIKFGVSIGRASHPIKRGIWVHLHNCESNFDARSGSLDLHTGATTDTIYE